jgi:putative ABC transport system ATP-binding protein
MGDSDLEVLKGINLKIKENEFISIMGPSGSGKSTLLHILGILDRPTSGNVRMDGVNTATLDDSALARLRGEKIGFVFQFFNLYPTLTARENVELPMRIVERNEAYRKKRSSELLNVVRMKHRSDHFPSQLSGGERQRIAIARSLGNDPSIILTDEPTGNLDTKTSKEILEFLKSLHEEYNKTIIMVTHESTIANYAKRKIYIKDGMIIRGG